MWREVITGSFCSISFFVCHYGIWSHHILGNGQGNSGNSVKSLFLGAPKSLQMVTAAIKLKDAYSLEGKL